MEGKNYQCLEQRVIQSYRDMLAPFHPSVEISEESQRDYHDFVTELLDALFAKPELLFPTLHEDDAFPNRFNCASYGKPKLKPTMKAIDKKLADLFTLLGQLGNGAQDAQALKSPSCGCLPRWGWKWRMAS